ncbi:hypothetical protein MBAV_004746 [Candidatus Magnetobacterium bavaricum]|uniref:Uncharacterized protein n=1 Tax=Candidatus Magnetobacterium bavaricum TaxID=29290 RepID=A0A0F3GMA8_9BACT|nr:hypothetical protein MBAV_004746 [Candidatus Magnetobacterium bavaricum]
MLPGLVRSLWRWGLLRRCWAASFLSISGGYGCWVGSLLYCLDYLLRDSLRWTSC